MADRESCHWRSDANSGSFLYGELIAPLSTVTLNATSQLLGNVTCDRLTLNGNCLLRGLGNQAPVLSVGTSGNQTITLPTNSVNLNATVTDDGLPGGAVSVTWSKVSGPGNVSFSAANANTTTATFTAAGTYVLRVTANDGAASSSDDVVVTVIPANQAPVVNAGADQAITLPTNIVALVGAATDDGFPVGSTLATTWTKVSGPGTVTFANATAASTNATFGSAGNYILRLTASDGNLTASDDVIITVNVANQSPVVSAGPDRTVLVNDALPLNGVITDDNLPLNSTVTAACSKVSGPGTVTFAAPNAAATTATFSAAGTYVIRLTASDRQLSGSDDVTVIVRTANTAPVVNAGPDRTVSLPDANPVKGKIVVASSVAAIGEFNQSFHFYNFTHDLADWFTGGKPGRFLVYSHHPTLLTDTLATRMAEYGHTWEINRALNLSLATLQQYDGVFLAEDPVDNQLLIDYVHAGGNVFLAATNAPGSLTTTPVKEIEQWNTFLAAFGLAFTNQLSANIYKPNARHPIFARTIAQNESLNFGFSFSAYYQPLIKIDPNDPNADIPFSGLSGGLIATYADPHNALTLNGTATDDGLAGSLSLTWSKVSGPGTVTLVNFHAPATTATFSAAGSYVLRLTASDTQLAASDDVIVTVIQPNLPPVVNAGADQTIALNHPVVLSGIVTDDGLPIGGAISVTWSKVSGNGTVTFANPTLAATTATFSTAGSYTLRLTASDTLLNASDDIIVTVNGVVSPPTAILSTPLEDATITERTDITGVVAFNTPTANWKLEYALNTATGAPSTNWTQFGAGTTAVGTAPNTSGFLAKFDPTLLLNGSYSIRLTVADDAGQTSTSFITATVEGQQKVGVFSLAFADASVPLPGLPVSVVRSYDSRNKQSGDFGVGWQLALNTVRVEKTGEPGFGWTQFGNGGIIPTYQLQPTKTRKVSLTFPDGRIYKFTVKPNPTQQQAVPISGGTIGFTQIAGTAGTNGATLEPLNHTDFFVAGGNGLLGNVDLFDVSTSALINPTRFKLTTAEKFVYVIDQSGGVQTITDPNGNVLSFTANGITHSAGLGVTFTRNAQGRITKITDPDNKMITYAYNAAGDLASVTDRENKTTNFSYDAQHNLKTIIDPGGQNVLTNGYDASGRLTSIKDAFNQTIGYNHDLDNHKETIMERNNESGVRKQRKNPCYSGKKKDRQ